jgi:hypothetical protein
MRQFIFTLFCILFIQSAYAQKDSLYAKAGLKTAYMGSIIYPGLKFGIEQPIKVKRIDKTKSWGVKSIYLEKYLTINLAYYHHPTFHNNLYLLAEWQMRRQKSKGLFFEFAPGLGFSRTFLGGATYDVSDEGKVTKKNLAGYNYAMISIAGGLGYDFSKKINSPFKVYLKPSIFFLLPYNSFFYGRPTIEIGMIYSSFQFLKNKPTFKTKKK